MATDRSCGRAEGTQEEAGEEAVSVDVATDIVIDGPSRPSPVTPLTRRMPPEWYAKT